MGAPKFQPPPPPPPPEFSPICFTSGNKFCTRTEHPSLQAGVVKCKLCGLPLQFSLGVGISTKALVLLQENQPRLEGKIHWRGGGGGGGVEGSTKILFPTVNQKALNL